jgi:hypothetical protein
VFGNRVLGRVFQSGNKEQLEDEGNCKLRNLVYSSAHIKEDEKLVVYSTYERNDNYVKSSIPIIWREEVAYYNIKIK